MLEFYDAVDALKNFPIFGFNHEYSFYLGYMQHSKIPFDGKLIDLMHKIQTLAFEGCLQRPTEIFLLSELSKGKSVSRLIEEFENSLSDEIFFSLLDSEQQETYSQIYNRFFSPENLKISPQKLISEYSNGTFSKDDSRSVDYYDVLMGEKEYEELQERFDGQGLDCLICYQKITLAEYIPFATCSDLYHVECLKMHLDYEINEKKVPICCPKCKKPIENSDLSVRLDQSAFEKYEKFRMEKLVEQNPDEYSCCPTADCQYIFIPNGITQFNCPICHKHYCLLCRVESHFNLTCSEYKEINSNLDYTDEDKRFMTYAISSKCKQCPKCKFWVEKSRGCNHMTCRCLYEFCYLCGAIHKTCKCSLF